MTNEQKKELLESYKELDGYIRQLIEEKKKWQMIMRQCKLNDEIRIAKSGVANPTETAALKVLSLERKIDDSIDIMAEFREMILTEVNALKNLRLQRIIQLKYISGMTFEQIADETGYCTRQVIRLHKTALDRLFEQENSKIASIIDRRLTP